MGRAITRTDFETVYSMIAPEVVRTFNEVGELDPTLILIVLDRDEGRIRSADIVSPDTMDAFYPPGMLGIDLMRFRDDLTTPGSEIRRRMHDADLLLPDIVVHVSEGWETPVSAEHIEQAVRGRTQYDEARRECILIGLQATAYSIAATCPIEDEPQRHAVLEALPAGPVFVGDRLSMTAA